jgi:hypothetical protein
VDGRIYPFPEDYTDMKRDLVTVESANVEPVIEDPTGQVRSGCIRLGIGARRWLSPKRREDIHTHTSGTEIRLLESLARWIVR